MYLAKLYRHNKILFTAVILFAIAQLTNNIRQDISISPFYSYGMYSEVIEPRSEYTVPEIFVNDKLLQTKDFTPWEWENVSYPATLFYQQKKWNRKNWVQDIHRLLPFTDSIRFVNNFSENNFREWYREHLQSVLNIEVNTTEVLFTTYAFDGNAFHKIKKEPAYEQ